MSSVLENEPRFSAESLRLLESFQQSFRDRVYNLIEDLVRERNENRVQVRDVMQCIVQALQEYEERMKSEALKESS